MACGWVWRDHAKRSEISRSLEILTPAFLEFEIGNILKGMLLLNRENVVHRVPAQEDRIQLMIDAYLSSQKQNRESTVLVCEGAEERSKINWAISFIKTQI